MWHAYVTSYHYLIVWLELNVNDTLKCCDYRKKKRVNHAKVEIITVKPRGMLKDAERVDVVTLARKGDINLKLSGQIFHTQLLSVILSMYAWKVGGGLGFMAVSCRRMADQGWQVTVGMGWGQILGKYFSMNSFTSAISCERKCD